jgi:hypothetical protein
MSRLRKSIPAVVLAYVVGYCGTYLILTLLGRYEPGTWGLRGPKNYDWAPLGFVKDLRWRRPITYFFLPLWEADRLFWHRMDLATSGRYPINWVESESDADPDNPTDGSQPTRPETNRTSSADDPDR